MELAAGQLHRDLAPRQAEGFQQHRGEVVEHAVGQLAGQQLRGQVAEQPGLTFATRRARAFLGRAAHQETHHHGHRQEHDGGHHLLGAVEAEPEPGRPIEEGQRHRGQQRRDQPAGQSARHRGDHDGQQEQGDGGGRPAPAQRDRGQPRYQGGHHGDHAASGGRPPPPPIGSVRMLGPSCHGWSRHHGFHAIFTRGPTDPSRRPHAVPTMLYGKELPILRITARRSTGCPPARWILRAPSCPAGPLRVLRSGAMPVLHDGPLGYGASCGSSSWVAAVSARSCRSELADGGHDVVVIDKDPEAFYRYPPAEGTATVVGLGFDRDVLRGSRDRTGRRVRRGLQRRQLQHRVGTGRARALPRAEGDRADLRPAACRDLRAAEHPHGRHDDVGRQADPADAVPRPQGDPREPGRRRPPAHAGAGAAAPRGSNALLAQRRRARCWWPASRAAGADSSRPPTARCRRATSWS